MKPPVLQVFNTTKPSLMEAMYQFAGQQYAFVKESRQVLLAYCQRLSPADLLKEHPSFGRGGSIRNLLVHIANTYAFWIGKSALARPVVFTPYQSKQTMGDLLDLFDSIDLLMFEFVETLRNPNLTRVEYEINGEKKSAAPFRLFSHVITHEFHHKGQILSLSRQWGYTPVDTDIMR